MNTLINSLAILLIAVPKDLQFTRLPAQISRDCGIGSLAIRRYR